MWRMLVTVMGFNYERGVGETPEAFGHRVESIMRHVDELGPLPVATQKSPHALELFHVVRQGRA